MVLLILIHINSIRFDSTFVSFSFLYLPVLVKSTTMKGVVDSLDGEFVYTKDEASDNSDSDSDRASDSDDSFCTMPIEIKAQVAHTTFYAKRHQLDVNLGLAAYENGEPVYHEIDAEGGEMHKCIPKHKESFQLLHHVTVRDARKGLFLVGNKKKIMFGVFVNYSDSLITSYQSILKDLYGRSLKPFYDGNLQEERIKKVLETKETEKLGVDYHLFLTDYYIWRQLCIEKMLPLQIPPYNRILPFNHPFWNNAKGASDTATKLM